MIVDLARRGLSHPHATAFMKRAVSGQTEHMEDIEVPLWGNIVLLVSAIVAGLAISLVSYMLNEVITTLCMVESPVAAITVSASTHEPADKEEKEGLLETGPTITLVNQKPITSSIRGTIKHVVAHAGRWARFRGYKIHLLYSMLFSMTSSFLSGVVPKVPGQLAIIAALSGALLANLHATWTHKVVSMPTNKSFYQRMPRKSDWKLLALPAAIAAAMPYIGLYLTCGVALLMGLHKVDFEKVDEFTSKQMACLIIRGVVVLAFSLVCTLFLCLPAVVTQIRIEASILPGDEDTIVPFDRTFGGKLVSQMAGGSGKISFLDAWRSFTWEARRRLIKLLVKVFLIIFGLMFVVVHVFVAEIFIIMGSEVGKYLAQAKKIPVS